MMMDYPTDVCFCGCDLPGNHTGSFYEMVTCSEHGAHPLLSIATYAGLLAGEWDTIAPPLMKASDMPIVRGCQRCGSDLLAGYCQDETCPYSDHLQTEVFSEG